MDSLQHQIALTMVPQVGAITAKLLVSYCGSAEAVFKASKKELRKIPGIGPTVVQNLQTADVHHRAERELAFIETHGIIPLFYTDARFPARLLQSYDSPTLLYFKGNSTDLLQAPKIVAIVGTRQPTEHGRVLCEELVEGLSTMGVVIVSGLAYGVDVTAHRKACHLSVPNIGILGHGLASIYPSQHRQVALKMIEHGGLLSEYSHDTPPDRENFPMRNRIIAGLCDALVVVETAASGGSMITASLANRMSCEVFAIPGRPHDVKSAGCNYLIRTQQAHLIETATDIAAIMRWDETSRPAPPPPTMQLELDPIEQHMLQTIRDRPEISIDQLALVCQLSTGELASRILSLEFRGLLKTLPGKRYITHAG